MELEADVRRELISCAPREIYREGGFYERPEDLSAFNAAVAEQAIEVLAELYPPFSYRRPDPVYVHSNGPFSGQLLDHYHEVGPASTNGPASVLVKLSDVTLCGTVIYVNNGGERRIVYETYRPPDRPDAKLWSGEVAPERYPTSPQTVYFFLGSVGSLNYGHWLVDDFPRLAAIPVLRNRFPNQRIEIILPSHAHAVGKKWSDRWNGVRSQSLRCALRNVSNVSFRFVELNRPLRFDSLCYATPVSYHPILKSKHALDFTATEHLAAQRWFDGLRRKPTRLFVVRRSSRGRALQNLDVVVARLEQHGFTVVDPEALSVKRQAMLFAGADIVVGVMGASMTNAIFCRAGARIIHLAPDGWLETFYWDLAAVRGHEYAVYFGSTGGANGPPHTLGFKLSEAAIDSLCASLR